MFGEFNIDKNWFSVIFYRNISEKTTEKILKLMKEDKYITIEELSFKISITPRNIEKNISKLKKDKLIERIGSSKGGYWKVL